LWEEGGRNRRTFKEFTNKITVILATQAPLVIRNRNEIVIHTFEIIMMFGICPFSIVLKVHCVIFRRIC